ncbi:hypothetical protein GGI04_000793 [Coemansia thaxteri]|nr:hypothetical protein GGI04_000793 [Coemansia thaxteri]
MNRRNNSISSGDGSAAPGSRQLQPLFDSSISLPHDGIKASTARMSSPCEQLTTSGSQAALHSGGGGGGVFGRLPPASVSLGSNLAASTTAQTSHARTASYGTTLLDTLNEEKQLHFHARTHQRHFTLMDAGTSGARGTLPAASLLSSSALRSSYSSNSLRASFGTRGSPSPLGADPALGASSGSGASSFEFESVWGPSGLSNELDILPTPIAAAFTAAAGVPPQTPQQPNHGGSSNVDGNNSVCLADAMLNSLCIGSDSDAATGSGDAYARIRSYSFNNPPGDNGPDDPDIAMLHAAAKAQNPALAFRKLMVARTQQHARSKTLASSSPFANVGETANIAEAMSHFPGNLPTSSTIGHSRQLSVDAANVHIGIGGESMRAFTRSGSLGAAAEGGGAMSALGSAGHSRQASATLLLPRHSRMPSTDGGGVDFSSDGVPTRSLWVGNVDPGLSSQDLVALFGKYGRVESLRLLPDKECAFVNFLRVEDAIRAREDMHAGARIGANTVRVGYGKGEAYASGDAQAMQPTRALWIGNIAAAASPDSLAAVFQQFGTIDSARVLSHKNCGFVNFVRLEDAVRAKQAMNGKPIDGSVVRIGYAKVPAAKNESALKLRNPVPSAAPLTASGQRAEDDAIAGSSHRKNSSDGACDVVLEPGVALAIDEDLVAFSYAARLPPITGGAESATESPLTPARVRDIRKLLENSPSLPMAEFDRVVAELMPHVVDLCSDYVGNVLIQKIAERGDGAQKLALARSVGPFMAGIGVHKNGTWAVQKIIDSADCADQRRVIAQSIRAYTPQLLLDQLGNYVVQGCLKFGAPREEGGDQGVDSSNQFVFDAIHARCVEIAQGRFGARAIRTCVESAHATRQQQKLVAVALVTNAVALATNANGHLLMNWLLDTSRLAGRFRVLAHQLAPHLRYLATHKLGASTVTKLVDQTAEPDARDLILNTLFFNPDPSVLDDVLLDHAQGVHLVLKILQGNAIGDAEKARIADRLRFVLSGPPPESGKHAAVSADSSALSPASPPSSLSSTSTSSSSVESPPGPAKAAAAAYGNASPSASAMPPAQRLADVVAAILAHSQPVYPPTMPPAAHRASATLITSPPPPQQQQQQQQVHELLTGAAFHHYMMPPPPQMMAASTASAAMSFPAAGYGGMAAGSYYMDPAAAMYGTMPPPPPPSTSSMPFYHPYGAPMQPFHQYHHHQHQHQHQQPPSATKKD